MKKMYPLIIIVSTALIIITSCKPKPILLPVLDNYDRKLLEHIKKQSLEGDSLVKLAKELPNNANLPLSYEIRVQYANSYFEQARKIFVNVQKKRNIADEIFAMKLAMYNKRSYFSKDTIIPKECKPCYEKLNAIESRLEYLELIEEIPTSVKGFESSFRDDCKCINEK